MFGNAFFKNRKGSKFQSRRAHSMQMEALEERDLLSVSPLYPDVSDAVPALVVPMATHENIAPKHELVADLTANEPRSSETMPTASCSANTSVFLAYPMFEESTNSLLTYSQAYAPSAASRPESAPNSSSTSDIMIGDVYVTVVLLESNGQIDPSTENWNSDRIANVKSEISEGLKWWEKTFHKYNPNSPVDLNFQIDFTYADNPFKTSYEPITHSTHDDYLWINEFLVTQGYTNVSSGYVSSTLDMYNDAMRKAHNCDWAYTIFVIDSYVDDDGKYIDGISGYARGYDNVMITYDCGGWEIENMGRTVAHETGHVFQALDEYDTAGSYGSEVTGTSWTDIGGYYGVQNLNAWDSPYGQFDSLMAGSPYYENGYSNHVVSESALQMIGWRDSDGNGLIDYLDHPLTLTDTKGEYNQNSNTFHFTGSSSVTCEENQMAGKDDHTLNTVDVLRYKIDNGSWQTAKTWLNSSQVDINSTINFTPSTGYHTITFQTVCNRTNVVSKEVSYDFFNSKLETPTLSVRVSSPDSISASIGSVPFASGYLLEYSTSPNFSNSKTVNVSENARTVSVGDLKVNTNYYFRVKAIGSGQYTDSNYCPAVTIQIIKLKAPTLSVSPVPDTSSASVTVGSVPNATRYRLEYSTDPDFHPATTTTVPAGTSYINGLAPNTTYYFRVMSIGTGNYVNSDYSPVQSITTDRIKQLTPRLNVSAIDTNSISVSISNVLNATGYILEYSKDPDFADATSIETSAGTSIISDLEVNTTYYFRVMAFGSDGYKDSNFSKPKSATTYRIQLDVPTLSVSATDVDSISVTVGAAPNASGYSLQYASNKNFKNATTMDVPAGSTTISELTANTQYFFRVMAIGTGDYSNSDYSSTEFVKTFPVLPIDEVGDTFATANEIVLTNNSYTFTDKLGEGEYGHKDVDIYKLTVTSSDIGFRFIFTTSQPADGKRVDTILRLFDSAGAQLDFTDDIENDFWYSSLTWAPTAAGTYYLGVSSYLLQDYDPTIAGSSTISGDQGDYTLTVIRTDAEIKLLTPTLTVNAIDSNSVSVNVGSVANASAYYLQYSENSDFTNAVTANVQAGNNNISGLTADTTYYFRVLAAGEGNYSNSDFSAIQSINTSLDVIQLAAPSLNVSVTSSDSISAVIGSVENASGYALQYSVNSDFADAVTMNVQAGNNIISGLTAGTTYYFKAMATGSENYSNSDNSAAVSAQTFTNSAYDNVGDVFSTSQAITFTDNTFTFTDKLGEGEYNLKDVDIYKLTVSSSDIGRSYTFTTSQPEDGIRVDTFIRLFNSTGDQIAYNDNSNDSYSYLKWTPASAGTYYLGVSSYLNKDYNPTVAGSASTNGSQGDYTLTVTRTAAGKLNSPALEIKDIGSDSVSVLIGAVTNASGYTLQYSTSSNFSNATELNVSAGLNTVSGLNSDTTYFLRAFAIGTSDYANSSFSETKKAKTEFLVNPDISVNNNQVTVNWVDSNQAADAIRYRVVGTTKWTTSNLNEGVTTYTFNGAAGSNYEIEVLLDQQEDNLLKGSAAVLDQPKLSVNTASIKDDTFQVTVTNYTAKNLASNSQQAIVTVNGVNTTIDIVNQSGTNNIPGGGKVAFSNGTFTFTEMASDASYAVQVSFSDNNGVSIDSAAVTVKTTKASYQTPKITSINADSDTSITVTWETSYGKNSDVAAQKYMVQYSTDGVNWTTASSAATGNTFTIQSLKGGVEYQVRVTAIKDNSFEASLPSDVKYAETLTLPTIALNTTSVADDSFQVNVTNFQTSNLTKTSSMNVKSDLFGTATIKLVNNTGTAAFSNGMTVTFKNGVLTFKNVPSNTQQKIQISFTKGACTTAWSQAVTVKTLTASYNKPVLTKATAVSSTSVQVEWETVYGKNSTTAAQAYTVQYSLDGERWINASTNATGTSYTITNLKPNTKYLVAVIANKDANFNLSQPSESLLVKTLS